MLANDSVTVAVEVPIWLSEDDIAALEDKYRITILPREPLDPARPDAGHKPRHITGHIDFLQARNGAIHILDYKPDARTNKPIAQLTIYAPRADAPGSRPQAFRYQMRMVQLLQRVFPRLLLRARREAPSGPVPGAVPSVSSWPPRGTGALSAAVS